MTTRDLTAKDSGARQESTSNNSNALGRAAQSYDDDDEFDVNDIEQYERLNNRKYRSATANAINEAYGEDDEFDVNDIEQRERLAKIRASQTKRDVERQVQIEQAYRCTSSSGKSGIGTGRLSQENEYSSFLNKGIQAGEFVIFKYQNSSKEYWFRRSNCIRL